MKFRLFLTRITFNLLAVSVLTACSALNFGQGQTANTTPNPPVVSNTSVTTEGNLVPKEFKYLSFLRGGRVGEILVKKGDRVSAGQVIARLGDRQQVDANLASAQLEILSSQQALEDFTRTNALTQASNDSSRLDSQKKLIAAQRAWDQIDTKDFQQKIDDANVKAQDLKTKMDDAQKEFDKYKDLSTDNINYKNTNDALKRAQLDYQEAVRAHDELVLQKEQAQANLSLAQANVDEAQYQFDLTKDGPNQQKLAMLNARLNNAKAQLASAQFAADTLEIKAPFAGEIVDTNVIENEQVGTSSWAFLMADFSEWYIETSDLTELKVVNISEGMPADLSADALPDVKMTGIVTEISKNYTSQSGDIIYKVRLKLNDPDPALRWGMTIQIAFGKAP